MIQKQCFWTLPMVLMIIGALAAVGIAQNVAPEIPPNPKIFPAGQ